MKLIEYHHRPSVAGECNGLRRVFVNVGPARFGVGVVTGSEYPLEWLALRRPACIGFTLWLWRLGLGFRWERRDWAAQNAQWMKASGHVRSA